MSNTVSKKTLNDFWNYYEQLADQGACDVPGGAEFERVQLEWQQAKRPSDIEAFIRSRANAPLSTVIDKPCPKCNRPCPHNLTDDMLSECRGCKFRWL